MRKVLITGGSHAELPMIEAAKRQGYYVITTGNNQEGLGHKKADKYIPGDFSDKEYVLSIAKENQVDAILSGCNDFAYLSTAYACEKLGLPGHDSYETALIIHRKDNFRKMTKALGIRTPKSARCNSSNDAIEAVKQIGYPIVIKPVDLTGGKGVKICKTLQELQQAYGEAVSWTRQNHIIVEECIIGTNHGTTMLLKNKKVVWSVFDDEQYFSSKYLVSGASMPSQIMPDSAKKKIKKDVEKIANHLDLVDGLFHTQFILEDNNEPVIIDPCRRPPGDLYVLLAKYHSGVDYPAEIVKAEMGEALEENYVVENNYIARECIMTTETGIIEEVIIDESIRDKVIYDNIWAKQGDVVEETEKYKAGIIILRENSHKELQKMVEEFQNLAVIKFSNN